MPRGRKIGRKQSRGGTLKDQEKHYIRQAAFRTQFFPLLEEECIAYLKRRRARGLLTAREMPAGPDRKEDYLMVDVSFSKFALTEGFYRGLFREVSYIAYTFDQTVDQVSPWLWRIVDSPGL
jgi:hypothetical protein